MESRLRSLVKSVSFRLIAVLGTIVVTWTLTRDIEETTWITLAVHLFLTALYFGNERLWNRIAWGRTTLEPADGSGVSLGSDRTTRTAESVVDIPTEHS